MLDKIISEAEDFLPILGTDHVEIIVGNAKQSAFSIKRLLVFKAKLLQVLKPE